jgi:hypothetical protein
MATKPLQEDPASTETEYSHRENIQDLEPVLVLRTARSLILPLRIPVLWKQQALAVPVSTRSITLSVGPGIDEGSVSVFRQSESIRSEGNWRACLYRRELRQPCWYWITRDARKIFMESEDHYRHADSRPVGDQPDFTAGCSTSAADLKWC